MTTKEMSDFLNSLWCWARCTEEEQRKLSEIADYLSSRGNEKNDCISRIGTIDYLCKHCPDDGECFKDCDEIKHLRQMPSVTPQEPITWIVGKNNAQIAVKNMPIDKLQKIYAIISGEQEPVLDKLRAEIKHFMYDINPSSSESDYACNYILQIIDKYKAETENP